MKRIGLEWGLILTVGVILSLSAFWVGSYFLDRSQIYLRIPYPPNVGYDLHITLGGGDICLFDQFHVGPSGDIEPLVVDPRTHIAPPIRRVGHVTIPGFDFQYCQFAPDGYVIWSLRLSLLVPIAMMLLVAVLLRRRLKRHRGSSESHPQSP
jgi:hypothetical protein